MNTDDEYEDVDVDRMEVGPVGREEV